MTHLISESQAHREERRCYENRLMNNAFPANTVLGFDRPQPAHAETLVSEQLPPLRALTFHEPRGCLMAMDDRQSLKVLVCLDAGAPVLAARFFVGTRGDVLPGVAICKALEERGHQAGPTVAELLVVRSDFLKYPIC